MRAYGHTCDKTKETRKKVARIFELALKDGAFSFPHL